MSIIDPNSPQFKILSTLYDIFIIIGYDEQKAAENLKKFISIAESRVMERVYNRMTSEQQSQFDTILESAQAENESIIDKSMIEQSFYKNYGFMANIIKESVTQEELSILYRETLSDLFEDYLGSVTPSMTKEQKERVDELLQSDTTTSDS